MNADIGLTKFDLSKSLQRRLSFMFVDKAPQVQSGGERQTTASGQTWTVYPWGIEHSLPPGMSPAPHLLRYYFPVTDVDWIVAYCMSNLFDLIHKLITDRDFGRPVTALVSKHWPTTMALLSASDDWNATTPALIKIKTCEEQWAVATTCTCNNPDDLGIAVNRIVKNLTLKAMGSMSEAKDGPATIPGLIQALGGKSHLTRRLDNIKSAIGLGTEIVELVSKLIK
jgi:hypothetical protein